LKLLSFILSLALVQPSYAQTVRGEAGHGDTQDVCAYEQTEAKEYKAQSVIDAEARLAAATKKQEDLQKELDRLDCSYCEETFRKVISIIDKDNYDGYIRHLEGGSACSLAFNNVDVYNHWAEINKWERIVPVIRSTKPIRNIAGGLQDELAADCPEGQTCGEGEEQVERPEIEAPDAPNSCLYYAGVGYTVKAIACENAKPHITYGEYRTCKKCVDSRDRRHYGTCLMGVANIEHQLGELEFEIRDLEFDLKEAEEDAEYNNEEKVCVGCAKDNRSAFAKWAWPIGAGIVAGGLVGSLVKNLTKDSYDEQVAHNLVIQEDNNAKGYPTPAFDERNNSKLYGAVAGLGVGGLAFTAVGLKTGAIGCSSNSIFNGLTGRGDSSGSGSGSGSSSGTGSALVTGLGGLLSGLFNGGGSGGGLAAALGLGGNTNGVTTGQAALPAGYTYDANGNIVPINTGVTSAQYDAEIAAANQRLAQLNAARTQQAALDTLWTDTAAQEAAIRATYSANGGLTSNGTSGVLAPSSNSVVAGTISLNVGANAGVGVLAPRIPTTTVPTSTVTNPAVPPTTTQPTGANRL